MDRDLVFRWVNPVFASFAHQPVATFAGRSFYDVFPHMENPNPRLVSVLEDGEVHQILGLPIQSPQLGATYWDIVYVPVFDDAGRVDGLMLMSQNATERVGHEKLQQAHIEKLQDMDRLKDEFLSVLSHELRTPINAVMGFASIVADGVSGPLTEDQARYMDRILEGAEVLLALINDLLDMSRIQAGKFLLEPAPMDLAQVASQVVATTTHLAGRKGQRLVLDATPGLPTLRADAQRIGQVLMNLVSNAIKFGPEDRDITIRLRPEGARVVCEVEDHGEGIAEADLPKLFQRFQQLDMGATRKAGGTGLGLYIVKALVESHGGEVGVRSVPGATTTFWFALPAGAKAD
jgi:signal transduction histidine kinase